MILTRQGNEVYFDGKKLTINAQASKGEGKEVVKIEGLEGSNGQKWVSLARLKEGDNEIITQAREVTTMNTKKYTLTADEKAKVDALQAQIDEIVNAAKARYVGKPKMYTQAEIAAMSPEQRAQAAEEIKRYYGL